MKPKKTQKVPANQLNLAIHRPVLDSVQGDFLAALIIEYIHYRCVKGDRKPTWLKLDWIKDELPYCSRSGLDKKLKKLVREGHIIVRKGEGKHYHKCFYSPSRLMREACSGQGLGAAKVYYNLELAAENLEASVVYAAIINLLRLGDELALDTAKLVEGSGLSVSKVRKAVAWLIKHKKIESKKVFGNKRMVKLPARTVSNSGDLASFLRGHDLPTESYPHTPPNEDEPTESYLHND